MTKKQFISEKFRYFQRDLYHISYDLIVHGFAPQDAGLYTIDEINKEYEKYKKNPEKWIKENES
jgi:hypothetical protein